jgi:hypothetical protein
MNHDAHRDVEAAESPSGAHVSCARTLAVVTSSILLLVVLASSIDLSRAPATPENDGVAFGRLSVVYNGQEVKNVRSQVTLFGDTWFDLVLLADGTSRAQSAPLDGDGYFFWRLPPGGYTIVGFEASTPTVASRAMRGRIAAAFLATANTVVYVGTLRLVFQGERYATRVEDESEHAVQRFRKTFPNISSPIANSLMVLEKAR